ncbi:MAG: nucleotidyltransferase domain-containing protein [bacterium]
MENKEYILNTAKNIISSEAENAGYKAETIYLFGSRARGDYKEYSDWDFFVVIDKEFSRSEKIALTSNIRKRLSDFIASDIIVKSHKKLLQEKGDKGLISYYVLKEGVKLG